MTGPESGDLLVVGWGGTFGAIKAATLQLREAGLPVSAAHLRYINPLPQHLGELIQAFKKVLVPELNLGQLRLLFARNSSSTPKASTKFAASRSPSPNSSAPPKRSWKTGTSIPNFALFTTTI